MSPPSSSPKTELPVVLGTMTFGSPGSEGVRVSDGATTTAMLDLFQSRGHGELDNARLYSGGTSESHLAQVGGYVSRGLSMATKLYPNENFGSPANIGGEGNIYSHRPEDIRRGLMDSLKALNVEKVDMWYLHGPDRTVPLEDTLRAVNQLYEEGRFSRLGISNYMSWEVSAMCEICDRNSWVRPSVYQGIYNALHRGVELELLPCLRRYGIALYEFQPLAGGFLTGRYRREMRDEDYEAGSRFDPKRWQGRLTRGRYMKEAYFDALDMIREAAERHGGLTEAECAFRWLSHHSAMRKEMGDKIIIGASSVKQLEGNLDDLEKGPLPEDLVRVMDDAWERVKGVAPKYFH